VDTAILACLVKNEGFSIHRYLPQNHDNDLVVICFDEMHGGLKKKGFGTDFLIKNNIESFFVSHPIKSFYQGLSEEDIHCYLGDYIRGKKVFTYGSSLGGYAALYFASVLNAKAIAFSPRLDIDPIYHNSDMWNVKLSHSLLDEQKVENYKFKPIVILDPNQPRDKLYYSKRILPLFGSHIDTVEVNDGTHEVAKALANQKMLKDFTLSILIENKIPSFKFNPEENSVSLSEMAYKSAKEENFERANRFLKKILLIGGEPLKDKRLLTYRTLIKNGSIDHVFDRNFIFSSEVAVAIKRHSKRIRENNNTISIMKSQFEFHMELMEYEQAKLIAEKINKVFPHIETKLGFISISNDFIEKSKKWLI
jgi:hypothetical protein